MIVYLFGLERGTKMVYSENFMSDVKIFCFPPYFKTKARELV